MDDINKIQDVTKCKTVTIEDVEHQKLEFEQKIKKLQSNKSWVKKQVKDNMVSEPYHATIQIHLKCQQCGYTCLSYDIFTAHQNRYCYYSRYQVISRMGSLNNNESSKQKYWKHNNLVSLDTAVSDIHQVNNSIIAAVDQHASTRQSHILDNSMRQGILATIPRLSTSHIGQQTTKKTLRSLRVSL